MSHTSLGFPDFKENDKLVDELVKNGVELIELQIPFSDPIADGPFFIRANQEALKSGTTVDQCLAFIGEVSSKYSETSFIITTYLNILVARGLEKFLKEVSATNVKGLIIPDLSPEEYESQKDLFEKYEIYPIFLVTPNTSDERIRKIDRLAKGMIYVVSRTGVTGIKTFFDPAFKKYIERVRSLVSHPIGVGFGVQSKEDVSALTGSADIAICCTQVIRLSVEKGVKEAGLFAGSLRGKK